MFTVFIKILDAIYPISCSFTNKGSCWKNTMCMDNDYINFMNWRKLNVLFCGKSTKSGIG